MRSGRAYLGKRSSGSGIRGFEQRELREVLLPARVEKVRETPPRNLPQSDLEKNQWSVVSFDGVEAGGLTYDQASRLIKVLGDYGLNGLCIITDVAALKID